MMGQVGKNRTGNKLAGKMCEDMDSEECRTCSDSGSCQLLMTTGCKINEIGVRRENAVDKQLPE